MSASMLKPILPAFLFKMLRRRWLGEIETSTMTERKGGDRTILVVAKIGSDIQSSDDLDVAIIGISTIYMYCVRGLDRAGRDRSGKNPGKSAWQEST